MNHGALVGALAVAIEAARTAGSPLGIALIDIDNFRLLNDNHGHARRRRGAPGRGARARAPGPGRLLMGRYGPDEFLLVAPTTAVAALEPVVERLRAALADQSLQFEATERLPITVSAGIATYPEHGASVYGAALRGGRVARGRQGERRRHGPLAGRPTERGRRRRAPAFDVFQGLVIAVDTKDRYTQRHSEDVARYSIFLAERLGLDADSSGRSESPVCSTTSARSASRTTSCASPAS